MQEEQVPKQLYHGSLYQQKELMPGFKRSGKLVHWDGIENNSYLYTTSVKDEAISLGWGSAVEKVFDSRRYVTFDDVIVIYFHQKAPKLEELLALEFFVYTIATAPKHNWTKNNNPLNNIDTEWITQNTIHSISKCERVKVKQWLSKRKVYLTTRAVDTCPRRLVTGGDWSSSTLS